MESKKSRFDAREAETGTTKTISMGNEAQGDTGGVFTEPWEHLTKEDWKDAEVEKSLRNIADKLIEAGNFETRIFRDMFGGIISAYGASLHTGSPDDETRKEVADDTDLKRWRDGVAKSLDIAGGRALKGMSAGPTLIQAGNQINRLLDEINQS